MLLFPQKRSFILIDETTPMVNTKGHFGETILEVATDMNVDIIVIGTHSRRGFHKMLLGSVTGKVLRHSSIHLFIILTKECKEK
jgi:nucleotide-binding universal stress UspA family protein